MHVSERVVLAAIDVPGARLGAEESLAELEALVRDAGAVVVGQLVQRRERADPVGYLGSGKQAEAQALIEATGADALVCDDELTPAQVRQLERAVGVRVIDRTQVILDIFARRARSREGKIQVELAQLKHLLPRLAGRGGELSRLGGGIGTRGPGESKLETDRRRIKQRIAALSRQLEEVRRRRARQRRERQSAGLPSVALVGYTNAGKSTLLNALTGADALAEDRLFATLDPTIRRLDLGEGEAALLIDTVGFVNKLSHELVAAFRATLEEAIAADVLVHVVDASQPRAQEQAEAVFEVLEQLGVAGRPLITVLNKADRVAADAISGVDGLGLGSQPIAVSALHGTGLSELRSAIRRALPERLQTWRFAIPLDRAADRSWVHAHGVVLSEDFSPEGVIIRAKMRPSLARRLEWAAVGAGGREEREQ
ncbi:MAG TPA: GTPase HflX [Limnochordia bacterium]